MIAYLDTSSLVKLYFEETGSEDTEVLVNQASQICTSWLTYTEARSAFARKYTEEHLTSEEYNMLLSAFEKNWEAYTAIGVSERILREAAALSERRGLRALDAIQLASALSLRKDQAYNPLSVVFSTADSRLQRAAEVEGLAPLTLT